MFYSNWILSDLKLCEDLLSLLSWLSTLRLSIMTDMILADETVLLVLAIKG